MNEVTAISGKAVAKISTADAITAIVPKTIEEVFRLGELIVQSGLAPNGLKTPQAVTVVLLKGLEIGMPPMAALESFGVINGKACIYGDGIPALLWAHGFDLDETVVGRGDDIVATCTVTRPNGRKITRQFSAQDAKDAGLWDKPGPWKQYRPRMCAMRARSWAGRDGASDILKGLKIFEEELDIPEMKDVTPAPTEVTNLSLPDIPELPDISDESQDTPDEPIADVEGFLAKLTEERGYCETEDDLRELAETNADIIQRLPDDAKAKAADILRIEE
jgi:hypothetical protein